MANLIDRNVAIEAIKPILYSGDFVSTLIHLPAVDAAPVEHSLWIRCDYVEYDHHGECVHYPNEGVKCFKCCYVFRAKYLWSREYCPHCGAKMDGGDSECD